MQKSRPDQRKVDRAIEKLRAIGGNRIRFIILYGSASEGRMRDGSDIDICVYYDDGDDASDFRLKVLSELFDDEYDIKIFQQMPLYLRIEVLKGTILYCDDKTFLLDKAYETIKEFDAFKHRFYDYIGLQSMI